MSEIAKGDLLINNIQLNVFDNLTEILRKTINMDKRIRNINNFQHLYFDTVQFYGESGRCRFIFNSNGILEEFSFGISEEDYKYSEIDEKKLILFLMKNFLLKLHMLI